MSPRSKTAEEDDRSDQEPFGDEEAGQESGVAAGGSTAKRTPRGTPHSLVAHVLASHFIVYTACDRCRRSKSRCIASTSGDKRCKACVAAGAGEDNPQYHDRRIYPHETHDITECAFSGMFHQWSEVFLAVLLRRSHLQERPAQRLYSSPRG